MRPVRSPALRSAIRSRYLTTSAGLRQSFAFALISYICLMTRRFAPPWRDPLSDRMDAATDE